MRGKLGRMEESSCGPVYAKYRYVNFKSSFSLGKTSLRLSREGLLGSRCWWPAGFLVRLPSRPLPLAQMWTPLRSGAGDDSALCPQAPPQVLGTEQYHQMEQRASLCNCHLKAPERTVLLAAERALSP